MLHTIPSAASILLLVALSSPPATSAVEPFEPPISFEEATRRADEILAALSIDEKIDLLGGTSRFFIRALPDHGVPYVFLADSTLGVRLASNIDDESLKPALERTTAFPSAVLLAATWNPGLAGAAIRWSASGPCTSSTCPASKPASTPGPWR